MSSSFPAHTSPPALLAGFAVLLDDEAASIRSSRKRSSEAASLDRAASPAGVQSQPQQPQSSALSVSLVPACEAPASDATRNRLFQNSQSPALVKLFGFLQLKDLHSLLGASSKNYLPTWRKVIFSKLLRETRDMCVHISKVAHLRAMCEGKREHSLSRLARSLDIAQGKHIEMALLQQISVAMPHLKRLTCSPLSTHQLPPNAHFQLRELQQMHIRFQSCASAPRVNASLQTLSGLTTLESFTLSHPTINSEISFESLQLLPRLTALNIDTEPYHITLAQAQQLAAISTLQEANFFCSTDTIHAILAAAVDHPLPWHQWCSHTGMDDVIAAIMPAALPNLTEIDLQTTAVTAASLASLAYLPQLTSLSLRGVLGRGQFQREKKTQSLGKNLIDKLHATLPHVTTLRIRDIIFHKNEFASLLRQLPALTEVRPWNVKVRGLSGAFCPEAWQHLQQQR
jgi:hypothetical protein